jgi:multisubunit Na+/H+ antiporter MnhC subunit
MSTEALVLTGILIAFSVFAVVLAWGDFQTRDIGR